MKIGPKYKIARRLGAGIFEKTQGAKYQARAERRKTKFSRQKTGFGAQLIEKQRARFMYGITDKQFKNYVKASLKKGTAQNEGLFQMLELRLDNVVYRAGFADTRRQARQFVSHGHIRVNGKKVNIPSFNVSKGDIVSIRKESALKPVFVNVEEKIKNAAKSNWITVELKTKEATVYALPHYDPAVEIFDLSQVFEFYRR
ncbi:MAG: 30S ribosomal protein S4 [Candidatus Paceibacterota bacterium]